MPGGPDSIEIIDVPVVESGPGEVQIRIATADRSFCAPTLRPSSGTEASFRDALGAVGPTFCMSVLGATYRHIGRACPIDRPAGWSVWLMLPCVQATTLRARECCRGPG
jgi:hypothetical protein